MDKEIKLSDVYILKSDLVKSSLDMLIKVGGMEKKTDMVVMSKEDFIKAIGDAFDAGYDFGVSFDPCPNKTEYLNNLKP